MIPWWGWVFILTFSLILGVGSIPFLYNLLFRIAKWGQHVGYAREARKHNERARQLRLEKTEYLGYPLPTGKSGTLRITNQQMMLNAHRVTNAQLDRAYKDRARDLWVDLEFMNEADTRDIVVRWRTAKGKRPREIY